MLSRRKIRKVRKDKQIFSRTAKGSKKINLSPRFMRGGIRL